MQNLVRIIVWVISLAWVGLFWKAESSAQTTEEPRRTTINFEDELIEGEVRRPELFYLLQKKQFNYKRLIKLREDFLPEMKRTSESLRHRGSQD